MKMTADQIQAAEKAKDDRQRLRLAGLNKRYERDQAMQVLSNGVTMLWHVPKELNENRQVTEIDGSEVEIITYPAQVPPDSFALVIAGKKHIFNTEEFRTWLRWA